MRTQSAAWAALRAPLFAELPGLHVLAAPGRRRRPATFRCPERSMLDLLTSDIVTAPARGGANPGH
ncbi:MAG: hypothetical protein U0163_17505 [Gemmatimonadaceae bacterium]